MLRRDLICSLGLLGALPVLSAACKKGDSAGGGAASEKKLRIESIEEALQHQNRFRMPLYLIARKQERFWKIREKIFL